MSTNENNPSDYSRITETPGLKATEIQIKRLYQRYHFALKYIPKGGRVLEVACGTGIGLGYFTGIADDVVGIDIDRTNLEIARKQYAQNSKITIHEMNAHSLQFPDKSFDLVLLYEAIYYLLDPSASIAEIKRVLRDKGVFILCTVNKEWKDFHPSPFSHVYYSIRELKDMLIQHFKNVTVYGAFPAETKGIRTQLISMLKRIASKFDLIPGSLKLRAYLKSIFIGKLVALPAEVYNDMAFYEEPEDISSQIQNNTFTILYAVTRK